MDKIREVAKNWNSGDAPPLSKKSWEMTRSQIDADNNKYVTTDQGINED